MAEQDLYVNGQRIVAWFGTIPMLEGTKEPEFKYTKRINSESVADLLARLTKQERMIKVNRVPMDIYKESEPLLCCTCEPGTDCAKSDGCLCRKNTDLLPTHNRILDNFADIPEEVLPIIVPCSTDCLCNCSSLRVWKKNVDNYYIGASPIAGNGLFSRGHIKRGLLLMDDWKGTAKALLPKPPGNNYQVTVDEGKGLPGYILDCAEHSSAHSFVNHSCNPNTRMVRIVTTRINPRMGQKLALNLVAIRDIFPGEEITCSYCTQYFLDRKMPCNCQQENCQFPTMKEIRALLAIQYARNPAQPKPKQKKASLVATNKNVVPPPDSPNRPGPSQPKAGFTRRGLNYANPTGASSSSSSSSNAAAGQKPCHSRALATKSGGGVVKKKKKKPSASKSDKPRKQLATKSGKGTPPLITLTSSEEEEAAAAENDDEVFEEAAPAMPGDDDDGENEVPDLGGHLSSGAEYHTAEEEEEETEKQTDQE